MEAADAIRVERVSKRFGAAVAVQDATFSVAPGEVVGFVGPNGAGKTTTMRMIAGYLPPDTGRVEIDGIDVAEQRARAVSRLGYLPETVPLYLDMRVEAYLRFRARIKGVPRAALTARVDDALERAGVADRRRAVISTLSKGYRQRVGIADALVAQPAVLVLDEPTSGLDPVQVRDLRALVRELAGERALLLSSHQLGEVEAVADRVVVIVRGRVVAEGPPSQQAGDRSLEDVFVSLAREPRA